MIAKGSGSWISASAVMAIFSVFALQFFIAHPVIIFNILFWSLVTVFFVIFFRDPERSGPAGGMISPADGKVMPDRGDDTVRIFMNVHNVHVNRAPLAGEVLEVQHRDGGLRPAFSKDSDRNERTRIVLDTSHGEVVVTQIAGTLARRIETYVQRGDKVLRGQRIGMIRLGSRVDVTIPGGFMVLVREGQTVRAGETVLAESAGRAHDAGGGEDRGNGDGREGSGLKRPVPGGRGTDSPRKEKGSKVRGVRGPPKGRMIRQVKR